MTEHKFSCIIPAYNEAGRVGNVVRAIKDHPLIGEIIVVSDGSTDNTAQEAHRSGAHLVIDLKKNTGKGGAVFVGAQNAQYPLLLLLDGDLVGLQSEHVDALTGPLISGEAGMTIGITNARQQVLPHIAGQRALKKELITRHPALAKSGFKFELLLNHYVKKGNYATKTVSIPGVSHLLKEKKYGLVRGTRMSFRMMKDICGRSLRNISQITLGAVSLWLYLTVFSPALGRTIPSYPVLASPTSAERMLVVAAHPDDEIIGAAGYIAKTVSAGGEAYVVVMTNGDANKFSAITSEHLLRVKSKNYVIEGNIRAQETLEALATLGVGEDHVFFLGFPDRGLKKVLKEHWSRTDPYRSPYTNTVSPPYGHVFDSSNVYAGEVAIDDLVAIIKEVRPTKIFTHSDFDNHPDHSETAHAVAQALARLGQNPDFKMPQRFAFLIHYPDFPRPLRYEASEYLLPPPREFQFAAQAHWVTFPLDHETENMKHEAVSKFKTQLESPFLNLLLKSFVRRNELFIAL